MPLTTASPPRIQKAIYTSELTKIWPSLTKSALEKYSVKTSGFKSI